MKLLYITNQICGAGGLERVLSIKTRYLAEEFGYEVHIMTINQEGLSLFYNFSEKLIYHNFNAEGNTLQYFLQYLSGLRKVVKTVKPDIISVCDDGLKGFFVPVFTGKPCKMIYERHVSKKIEATSDTPTFLSKLTEDIKYKLMHVGAKKYDKFVVLTNGNINEWKLDNILVISNPLSFSPEKTSPLNNKKVLAVGRQCFQKGYDRLLKSWQKVSHAHPDWKLEIYGKINENEDLNALAHDLKINTTISFFAPIKNIQEKYKKASVYVMSSRSEGFGMVLIEAMAHGVPCVSYDCPHGPADIITDGVDGYLVPNGDIHTFADRIVKLIEDEPKRKEMGKNAVKKTQLFAPDIIIPQWDKLFKSLIE
ncbi:glycosyltransferase family 4 protein [Abyssalbus ytuae]|uniref:Glycosyltransferase family 4 protein n=1 Tax=Abyssalbus ytuae TaxID=2926907 RepID=A0A9E7D2U4_9FLAO|nr:glycosyltransferase family 4 protein [Abyssalbus ytuae]UOB17079.1 glycosyltransferase family 4 protein [Abyssalbus ytuae]